MALPFSQSMRALQADRAVSTTVGLAVGLTVLVLWGIWFFWAPITRYETGTVIGLTRDGRVVAEFSAQATDAIWQGQPAYIRLHIPSAINGATGSDYATSAIESVPAVVANVLGRSAPDRVQISFTPQIYTPALEPALAGEVAVEVERVSPATLVARATGQWVDTAPVTFSPQ
ncbi:MAG: hypothetical protein KDE58_21005 [Caldilineaceae bacterium]|nr:hypothetical protein [Caldilineaceae bacterium]